MAATRNRYTTVAILLHWLIAAAILFQLALGWRMEEVPKGPAAFSLFQLHKSIGFSILLLVLLRLAWRFFHPPPPLPAGMPGWERQVSRLTHALMYFLMLAVPLTGWLLVSTSRTQIPSLMFGVVPVPHLPGFSGLVADSRESWHEFGEVAHGLLATVILGLVAMHVGAVLKHQLIVRDSVLAHMAPGARPGWLEPRLWGPLALAAAVLLAGFVWPRLPDAKGGPGNPTPAKAPQVAVQPVAAPVTPQAESVAMAAAPVPVADVPAVTVASAAPVRWTVSKGSRLNFGTTWDGTAVDGEFQRWQADIRFSEEALAASSIKVTVDLASVASGDAQRDATLPGEDWFNAAQYPQAVFKATGFKRVGEGHYQAAGQLNLRGQTSPVTLDFRLKVTGNQAVAEGSTTLDRTVFGVGQGEFAATDAIPAAVSVTFKVLAQRG